jgi:MEMO1 family protein
LFIKEDETLPQETGSTYIRMPAVAGRFYDGNPEVLRDKIRDYINRAERVDIPGTLIGFISPHAGYMYSGPVAGYVYKQIMGKKYKTVFVLAPSHYARFPGVSVIPVGIYRTPLGDVEIDRDRIREIVKNNTEVFRFFPEVERNEHSLEVQVPFLQYALEEGWKIVPLVFGQNDLETSSKVVEAISSHFNPDEDLIIASSDMSHYYPQTEAEEMDKQALEMVTHLDIENLMSSFDNRKCEMCGSGPVITTLLFANALEGKAKILKYATSGDITGDRSQVVGYGAVAFYADAKKI